MIIFLHSIVEQIGSGQFGMVSKGEWVYGGESMEIAVKTLKQQADEGDRIKFLQEAAIMGQFHHPNIIRLHGVVTVGDPVQLQLMLLQWVMFCNVDFDRTRIYDQWRFKNLFKKFCHEVSNMTNRC